MLTSSWRRRLRNVRTVASSSRLPSQAHANTTASHPQPTCHKALMLSNLFQLSKPRQCIAARPRSRCRTKPEQDPVFQVLHAHQTLPPECWEAFGQACTVVVGDLGAAILTTVQEGPGPSTVAYGDLKTFPSYTLCDTKDSKPQVGTPQQEAGEVSGG